MTPHDPQPRPVIGAAERTGRYLLSFPPGEGAAVTTALRDRGGLRSVAAASDLGEPGAGAAEEDLPELLLFPHLSAAVLSTDADRLAAVARLCRQLPLAAPEPERWVYPSGTPPLDPELHGYLRGYRDGVASVVDRLVQGRPLAGAPVAVDGALTWGLQVLGVEGSGRTGRGVRVAVLDTGLDGEHPDLSGRAAASVSFVPGEGCDDVLGHGTHCAGTLCGPVDPLGPTRYGVAPGVELYVAKVLGGDGRGREGDVLAGIDWAVGHG